MVAGVSAVIVRLGLKDQTGRNKERAAKSAFRIDMPERSTVSAGAKRFQQDASAGAMRVMPGYSTFFLRPLAD